MSIAVAGATGLVGRRLTEALQAHGHRVVALSRSTGTDLLRPEGLQDRLSGVSSVIDVTNSADPSQEAATAFFATATRNLAAAAASVGVGRLLVLSIIGTDLVPTGYYAAKVTQEAAARASFPRAVVLRTAPFHEFAEQSLGWGTSGGQCLVPDMPIQPVALSTVIEELVARAAAVGVDGDLAGPERESLPDMVQRLVSHRGDSITVVPQPVEPAVRGGALLPGPRARLAGPTYQQWLATRQI